MGFLSSTLQLIDFLAWPVLALGYPICASIRAIETGSKYHMRNLVTYWTIFSFISLFEHVFEKLIEWVPLWPYIKLIAICWLVIPEFNGACYSYQHLVHPCLPLKLHDVIAQFYVSCYVYQCFAYLCSFVNLQTFTDWFNKPMEDPDLKNETFLERYLEENGSDALVKLISNKVFACNGSTNVYFGRARGYFFLNFTGGAFVLVVEQDKEQAGTTQVL
ncbi:HVA22-like protein a isoform X2 [Nicotiana tabacum]|uniref:HVA22-like protein a isoform X2 n=1 Tax=Nicotiana tabacum TaxID=4097 RepID=A0AC58U137_TOBAC